MLKVTGEVGIKWVTDLCNKIVQESKITSDWSKSWMVKVYKGKGDALECDSYRGIKLLDHVLKIFERVVEKRVRNKVSICSSVSGQERELLMRYLSSDRLKKGFGKRKG